MKKIYLIIIVGIILLCSSLVIFNKENKKEDYTTLKVGEVTHSAFYAPFYVAIEKGYFEEEGLKLDISLISGANNVTAAVLSKDIDIGFCGPEATIYVYNGGENDYIRSFAGLTKRDGQFLVSRKKINDFNWNSLKGKEVLAGRIAGMPELNFENALKNEKISKTDVKINTSVDFASLTSAFISGTGDFVNLFEPNATKLENEGFGYIVANIGEKSGEMPYTAFNARKSFINKNTEIIKKFTKAINKGLTFTKEKDSKEIAKVISPQFQDISLNDLEKIVKRYKDADSWLDNPYIEKELFENLEDIMIDSKQIKEYVPYNDLVDNAYKK